MKVKDLLGFRALHPGLRVQGPGCRPQPSTTGRGLRGNGVIRVARVPIEAGTRWAVTTGRHIHIHIHIYIYIYVYNIYMYIYESP